MISNKDVNCTVFMIEVESFQCIIESLYVFRISLVNFSAEG